MFFSSCSGVTSAWFCEPVYLTVCALVTHTLIFLLISLICKVDLEPGQRGGNTMTSPWKILFRQVSSCPPCSPASRRKNPKTKISVLHKLFVNPDNSSKKLLDRTVEQRFPHGISVHMGRHAIAHGLYLIFWWGVCDRQWMCTPNPHYNLIL